MHAIACRTHPRPATRTCRCACGVAAWPHRPKLLQVRFRLVGPCMAETLLLPRSRFLAWLLGVGAPPPAQGERTVLMRVQPDALPPHPWDTADRPLRRFEKVLLVPVLVFVCVPLLLLRVFALAVCAALSMLVVLVSQGRRDVMLPPFRILGRAILCCFGVWPGNLVVEGRQRGEPPAPVMVSARRARAHACLCACACPCAWARVCECRSSRRTWACSRLSSSWASCRAPWRTSS